MVNYLSHRQTDRQTEEREREFRVQNLKEKSTCVKIPRVAEDYSAQPKERSQLRRGILGKNRCRGFALRHVHLLWRRA